MLFKLPDLGEGLQEAEIVEWLVKEGETVEVDQLILLVETAKAIVEIPSSVKATILKINAAVGDVVRVGETLVEYGDLNSSSLKSSIETKQKKKKRSSLKPKDKSVSVVGRLETSAITNPESFKIGTETFQKKIKRKPLAAQRSYENSVAPPSIIAFAKKIGLESELSKSAYGEMTHSDLSELYEIKHKVAAQNIPGLSNFADTENKLIKLVGAKKVMAQTMTKSFQQVPAVTLFDDANITKWTKEENITLKLLYAMIKACETVPLLNAWFDNENLTVQMFKDVNIGVAVNVEDGLYVPVIKNAQTLTPDILNSTLFNLIEQVKTKKIQAQQLMGATITLSNFGTLSGRYATPIVVPPQVAILGVGKLRNEVVVNHGNIEVGNILPVSLSFDHRVASGADASAFLESFISNL